MRKIVSADKAPAAIGPYVQANVVNELVFTSGQIPIDPASGKIVPGGVEEQTRQVFANLKAILEEAGSGLDQIVKTTCFLSDIKNYAAMNRIYAEYFGNGVYPSRSAFEVGALPKGAMIEIEAVALVKKP